MIAPPLDLPLVLDAALDPIRINGRTQPTVMVGLLNRLATVGARSRRPGDRAAVLRHALLVHVQATAAAECEHDRKKLDRALNQVQRACVGELITGVAP